MKKQLKITYIMKTFILVLFTFLIMVTVTPAYAQLKNGSTLTFDLGDSSNTGCTTGGCFGMEVSPGTFVWTPIKAKEGIIIGAEQLASGSHGGAPNDSENPSIDDPWAFFGNTGMHFTSTPIIVDTDDENGNVTLNMTGLSVTWNNIPTIPMGGCQNGDTANNGGFSGCDSNKDGTDDFTDTSRAVLTCENNCSDGESFSLDYTSHVPVGDASGFGGVLYQMKLFGTLAGPANTAPVALNGNLSTEQDVPKSGTLQGTDADNDSLIFEIVSNGSLGTAEITNDQTGEYTYTPNQGVFGIDSFTFKVNDGADNSLPATIDVTIMEAGNTPPVATDSSISTDEDVSVTGQLEASDVDENELTYTLLTDAVNGKVIVKSNGEFTYISNANYNGTDTFSFTVMDASSQATGNVSITVNAVNDKPMVENSVSMRPQNSIQMGKLSSSDVDGENETITFTITKTPANGKVTLDKSAVYDAASKTYQTGFVYEPKNNFTGTDSFTFTSSDGTSVSDEASVFFTVTTGFENEDLLEGTFGCASVNVNPNSPESIELFLILLLLGFLYIRRTS